jgi:hypothetical protein
MLEFERDDRYEDDHSPTQADQEPIADSPVPVGKKKPRSEKQREASRRNGSKGDGPDDTTRTRYNALRHGLRAQGLTPWDDPERHFRVLGALEEKYSSSDPIDEFFVQEAALEMVRMRRINRLEADNIIAMSAFSDSSDDPTSKDAPATIHFATLKEYGAPSLDLINRYKTSSMNRLLRWRRELERIARDEARHRSVDQGVDDDSIPM